MTTYDKDYLMEQEKAYEAFKCSSLWNRIQQEYQCIFHRSLNYVCALEPDCRKVSHTCSNKQNRY